MKIYLKQRNRPVRAPQGGNWLLAGALNGLLAVAAGAFGAHGLEGNVPAADLAVFRTASAYHMYHALALLAVAWRAEKNPDAQPMAVAGWCFLIGIILFCGSLYVLGVTGSRALVMLTPLGGLLFMAGWAALIWPAMRQDRP